MNIQERLQDDLKQAMRSGDKVRVGVIRSARDALQKAQLEAARLRYEAAARQIEAQYTHDTAARDEALASISADYRAPLDGETQESVIAREVKKRYEAADVYRRAGSASRAEEEETEAHILESYLPQQLSADELRPQIAAVISELGLSGPAAMGKLMPILIERFKGQADGRLLNQIARELLH